MTLSALDWALLFIYFTFVLGIGVALPPLYAHQHRLLSGRTGPSRPGLRASPSSPPTSAQQELIGMARLGGQVRHRDESLLLDRRRPGDVVRRHLHDALLLRLHAPARSRNTCGSDSTRKPALFNAVSFALMTVFSSGISMYAMAKLLQLLHILDVPFAHLGLNPGVDLRRLHRGLGGHRARLHPLRRTVERHLQ